ncbi:MAG: adenylate/guanylate cyclase domain-containing protein, partial [Alphaproteobacteria bacterium]
WSSKLDPEETHAILNRYFEVADEIVASFGGRVDKHIGDAVMAVFGAPVAHGNDAERAVRAALEIHKVLTTFEPPMTAHIGVANGVVVASRTGSETHREYTVTGNSVNLASRLQNLAKDGQTLVSESIKHSLESKFDWEDMGDTTIKGLDRAVAVSRVIGLARTGAGRVDSDIVGRVNELAQLKSILQSMKSGGGSVIQLRGEPGIGKSRLTAEFRHRARDEGFAAHVGQVLDFGTAKGRGAIAAIVRSLLGVQQREDDVAGSEAVQRARDTDQIGEDDRAFVCDLIDLPVPADSRSIFDAMGEEDRNSGKRTAFVKLATEAADRAPLLVVVEDIHWADAGTLLLLARLAKATVEAPILLLMTTRIEGDPIDYGWRADAHGARITTMDLSPLSDAEAAEYAARQFDVAEGLIRASIKRAAGNPLFLEQLLRSANEIDQETLPGTVQSIVQSRVDALKVEDRHALQAAAVMGQRFSPEAVRFILGAEHYACDSLVAHFLIRRAGDDFMFTHALVRDGVYSSLIGPRRKELHSRAAEWFGEGDLTLRAEHLERAGDKRAAGAFAAAAKAEVRAYHIDKALTLTEDGIGCAEGADWHVLACLRGDLLRGLGSIDASIEAFNKVREAATDDVARCQALIGLGEGMRASGQMDEAMALTDQALTIVGDDNPEIEAEIHHLRGNLFFPAGDVANCLAEHEAALREARRAQSPQWEARALGGLGDVSYLAARMRTACEYFKECVALSQDLGLGRTEVANRHMIGWTRIYLNEYAAAQDDGEASLDLAMRSGQRRSALLSRQLLALLLNDSHRHEEALEQAELALEMAAQLGHGNFEAQALAQRAQALAGLGRIEDARAGIDQTIAMLRDVGMNFLGPWALTTRGILAADQKSRAADFAEAESILAAGCVSHNYFWCYRQRMEAALANSAWDEAEVFATKLEDYAKGEPLPWSDLLVAGTRAVARAGRGERTDALSRELHDLLSQASGSGFAALVGHLEAAAVGMPERAAS